MQTKNEEGHWSKFYTTWHKGDWSSCPLCHPEKKNKTNGTMLRCTKCDEAVYFVDDNEGPESLKAFFRF